MLSVAFAQNSHKTYSTGWHVFCQFTSQRSIDLSLPVPSSVIQEFIAWLSLRGSAPSTIATYVSGVGFHHKVHGHPDPTKTFLVSKMLVGCRRDRQVDKRRPITVPVLYQILAALSHVCSSRFEELLFKASMLCAFFGFMRVGEFTADSKGHIQESMLQLSDVTFSTAGINGDSVLISFRTCKNNQSGNPLVPLMFGFAQSRHYRTF